MKSAILIIGIFVLFAAASGAFPAEEVKRTDFVKEADEAIRNGKYTQGALLLRKAVDRDPKNWDVRLKLIVLLVQVSGKETDARIEIRKVLMMKEADREYLEKIAAVCEKYEFSDEAVKLYRKIVRQEKGEDATHRKLIGILITDGNTAGARREIDIYLKNADFTLEQFLMLGRFCEKELQFETAAHVYGKIVDKHPDYFEARLSLAKSHARSGNLEEAKKAAEKCVESKPGHSEARLFLAGLKHDCGDYEGALELFEEVLKETPSDEEALSGKAGVLFMTGRYAECEAAYKLAAKKDGPSASVLKKLGDVYRYTGRYEEAEKYYRKAVKADPSSTDAIIGLAESYQLHGKFSEAEDVLYKLYDVWDAVDSADALSAEVLTNIGTACHYNDNPEDALTCYTMAQKKNSRYLPASIAMAALFLERHQTTDAEVELRKVLDVNPRHPYALSAMATVHLMRGRYELVEETCGKALAVNPMHIESLNIMALMYMFNQQWEKALENINKALGTNPNSLETQSSLAAYYYHTGENEKYEEVQKKVLAINPKYAELYRVVAFISEKQRRNAPAIELLRKAIAINPDHAPSYASLGMIIMREGLGDDAEEYLDKAFELDSYNPRMANTLNLLKYIRRDFVTEETDHFVLRWDREKDFVLKYFLAQHAENICPKITQHFGFETPSRTVFDMFPEHKWFSSRISGMPFIATVGACFGKVFAMDSPRKSGFNWRKVLEHEYTHVITLQQTNFNIPFWFTEGLAVHWEKGPRPVEWDRMLVRMKVIGELVPLDELNSWFTRPKNMNQKQWAYAQSELIVEYIHDNWGHEAIVKMLKMYADAKPTSEVIQECLGISQKEFEKRIYDYCMGIAATIPLGPKFLPGDKERLEKVLKDGPDSPENNLNYARVLLQTVGRRMKAEQRDKIYDEARKYARKAIELSPPIQPETKEEEVKTPWPAPYSLLAYMDFTQKKYADARKHSEQALEKDPENFAAHYYLGKLDYQDKKFDETIAHFEMARSLYAKMTDMQGILATIYKDRKDDRKFVENLEEIIVYNRKPYNAAKQLLRHYADRKEYKDAARIADLCLCYNLYDPEVYKLAGDAHKGLKNEELHKKYYSIGSEVAWWFGSKEVRKDRARKFLTLTIQMDPEHKEAQELLDKIGGPVEETTSEPEPESADDLLKLRDEGVGEEKKEEEGEE